jgi:hypothetical protein
MGIVTLGFVPGISYGFAMTEIEQNILQVLTDLENAVKSMPAAKPNLPPLFKRLDELTRRLPTDTDPTLLHYLHKNSYEKARLWLEGRDAENQAGSCRPT